MTEQTTLEVFQQELDNHIENFRRRRLENRRWATTLKVGAVILGASITVLLGLESPSQASKAVLVDVALVFAALITILNGVEAFFGHRGLWLRYTVTLITLYNLRDQLRYEMAATNPDAVNALVERLRDRMVDVLAESNRDWLQIRSQDPAETSTK